MSTLSRDAEVFVPMLYKMGISSGERRPLAYTIGADESIEVTRPPAGGDRVYKLGGPGGEFIPQQRTVGNRVIMGLAGQLPRAGSYGLSFGADTLGALAFNYDRRESDLTYTSPEELAAIGGVKVLSATTGTSLADGIREANEGRPLWKYFIWLALACLLAEALVLRFWRV